MRHRQAAVLIPNVVTGPLKMVIPNKEGKQRGGRRRALARRTCRSTWQRWTSISRVSRSIFNEPEGPPEIDEEELQRARTEEVSFMKKLGVWEPSSLEECLQMTGRPPVSTRWVDVDKGREGRVEIRSRLVTRDFRVKGDKREVDTFAEMSSTEAKRVLFRMAMLDGAVGGNAPNGGVKLTFRDIKKAHLNEKLVEDEHAYVQLPLEAGGGVARLRRWLYGMRQAASAWEEDYAKRLEEIGFIRGRSATTLF